MIGCGADRYTLTVEDPNAFLYEQPSKQYHAGEDVIVKTYVVYDADMECFVNGESIGIQTAVKTGDEYTHWEYYFEMPAEDVTITFQIVGGKSG